MSYMSLDVKNIVHGRHASKPYFNTSISDLVIPLPRFYNALQTLFVSMRCIASTADLPSPMNMEMSFSSSRASYEAKDDGIKRSLEVLGPQRFLLEGPAISSSSSPLKKRSVESGLSSSSETSSNHRAAALELEKVYRGFRTRRRNTDCAVLEEQRWWKLLDFVLLKLSSVSFFDTEEPETAVSRWSRARTRAAKVGKGLSKDEKAQKLALQHWLEAIDPRHRYGHNLQLYYECWLQSESMEPFFYWLDVGEGKEVNIEEQCSRSMLQQQCVKYLGPKEREAYEVMIEDGKFLYRQSRQFLNTFGSAQDTKWIFVLSTSKKLYVGQKQKGKFQHSSFLAGGATSAAGQLVVEDGTLKAVWRHSGHYRPTEENFEEFMSFLVENKVDLADVEKGSSGVS